ncbi:fibrinolytic enzyme, isozyme C-like [Mizuhopecten yessoensis]|uniref:Fibrinolytic enzyme, isozyme C n=1 Tax=Mizuhopecten yessoensis TaxID=6573 RepID=A0A210Q454_MIZYE|nr:fibrinolytic enzyme, isozyme C-like [Mizuhopecten yessoensis]OWF43505.1 Fibrinolytic enzyme, isozyme C [Mizuhopecten yessoensis]
MRVNVLILLAGVTVMAGAVPSSRIVGGAQADPNEWPWQVSLQSRSVFFLPPSNFCGGSLIAPDVVLTAAHCVDGTSPSSVTVVAGLHRQGSTSGSQTVPVSRIIMHPQYDNSGAGFPNDIAVLRLSRSVSTADKTAQIVQLPGENMSFLDNPDCWITGWGKTDANSGTAEVLMEARMEVISNGDCEQSWSQVSGASIYDTHICIEAQGKSACSGDSGGPLVCRVDGKYALAGATSWGITTCEGFPSVYVRVSKYLSWINSNM